MTSGDMLDIDYHYMMETGLRGCVLDLQACVFSHEMLKALEDAGYDPVVLHKYEKSTVKGTWMKSVTVKLRVPGGHTIVVGTQDTYHDPGPFEGYAGEVPTEFASSSVCIGYDGKADVSKIVETLKKVSYKKRSSNSISILGVGEQGMFVKTIPMEAKYAEIDLDLHYGTGFSEYHKALVKKIGETSKGIALLHGEPGTGKSFYIRHLISTLTDKLILYIPNAMIHKLASPDFSAFLIDWISEAEDEAKKGGVLLVLEDAEKSLMRRDDSASYSEEVSSILNATDGIMNDFLGIQLLVTFNVDPSKIDPAILRKRRAISTRSFGKLKVEDAKALALHLGVQADNITEATTLADIYHLTEEVEVNSILFQELPGAKPISFGRA